MRFAEERQEGDKPGGVPWAETRARAAKRAVMVKERMVKVG